MIDEPDLLGHTKKHLEKLEPEASGIADASADSKETGNQGRYKRGNSRFQSSCVGLSLDDRVADEAQVRLIDLYVNQLKLKELGFTRAVRHQSPGQPAYDPACLLKLYLYGHLNKVRGGRRLERECQVNIEVMWLLEELTPRYRVINTFRGDNCEALVNVHREFIMFCDSLSLIGGTRISIDGTHMKGNVSAKSFKTEKGLKRKRDKAQKEAAHWQAILEAEEKKEAATPQTQLDITQAQEALAQLDVDITSTQEQIDTLKKLGKTQHSSTDPDARLLRKRNKAMQGYNVQIATDHKHFLIVGDAVTSDANDLHQLHPIALQVKNRLGLTELEAVADKGYYHAQAIGRCIEDGITPYVAIPTLAKSRGRARGYARSEFLYDEVEDVYRCPADQLLSRVGKTKPRYRNRKACSECEARDKCLTGKTRYREIWPISEEQWAAEHEQLMTDFHQRMEQPKAKEIYAERHKAVEHPFGTLKSRAGHSHFLVRGKQKVAGEWSLMALCYNFTRVLNILGFEKFKVVLERLVKQSRAVLTYFIGQFKAVLTTRNIFGVWHGSIQSKPGIAPMARYWLNTA